MPRRLIPGRIVYFLGLLVFVQFSYPFTSSGSATTLLIYQLLFATLIASALLLDRERWYRITLSVGVVVFLLAGSIYALNTSQTWALWLGYITYFTFNSLIVWLLARFIFAASAVDRDVLYAAVATYILIGGVFITLYGTIETLRPGSFLDTAFPDRPIVWQQLSYYSYVTLTTVGYGDILPRSMWARSLATVEAVSGVLYTTIIMARLVSLYIQERNS
jgi:hypothetical protein